MQRPSKTKLMPSTDSVYLDFILNSASIGTWEYVIKEQGLHWGLETKKIHELPHDYVPNVEEAINFYKAGKNRDTITKLFSECIENLQSFDVDLQITTAKGNDKWVRSIAQPLIENGELKKVIGVFQDINEKTIISKNLAAKEAMLSKIFDHAMIGKATINLQGEWLKVNNSLCDMLGYTEKEFLNFTSFKDIAHPEDAHVGLDFYKKMLAKEINNFKIEKRYISKKGEVIYALLSASIVNDKNNKPQFIIIQISDLTNIKKASREIEKLLNTTENQNKRLLNFAHIVSHNLRSHSGNLKMLLDIIKTDLTSIEDNEAFSLLDNAVDELQETVSSLNEVATINIGNDLSITHVNLFKSFKSVLASINAQVMQSKAKLTLDIDPDLYVNAVPAYLDSIILNFLTNAIKYKKPNIDLEIDISAVIKKEFVVLKIKDNGLGIDLEQNGPKLFGMYKTFHKHKDARGIGLFITKNQVESIGGKIEVKSKVNIGSTFFIYLKHHENN
jgi:PAS domain S-box-containing protein